MNVLFYNCVALFEVPVVKIEYSSGNFLVLFTEPKQNSDYYLSVKLHAVVGLENERRCLRVLQPVLTA